MDQHKNFATTTVSVAPSPALSGTALTVADGSVFPASDFSLVVCPANTQPTLANAEIIRVTTRTGNVLSPITRAQNGTGARTIIVGDTVFQGPLAEDFTAIETAIADASFIRRATITLTNAQIKALPTTPVEIIAAPGSGKVIVPVFGILALTWFADYTNIDAAGFLEISPEPGYNSICRTVPGETSLLALGESAMCTLPAYAAIGIVNTVAQTFGVMGLELAVMRNKSQNILAENLAGNFTGGHASNTLKVFVYYSVEDL